MIDPSARSTNPAPKRTALGEELPIFCEKCGYSLHGLPQNRCHQCTILQFHCPECGHHQAINTLRPAFQTMLGRLRGVWLAIVVFLKFNFFIWTLIAWAGMGHEWSYQYDWNTYNQQQLQLQAQQKANPNAGPMAYQPPPLIEPEMGWDAIFGWGLFGLAWGGVGRMLLLRWRRGYKVGPVLAALALAAVWVGVSIRYAEGGRYNEVINWPVSFGFFSMIGWGMLWIVIGAVISWGVWSMLAKAFLPKRTADALLDWQRSLSISVSALAREKHDLIGRSANPATSPSNAPAAAPAASAPPATASARAPLA